MKRIIFPALFFIAMLAARSASVAADPVAELSAFSVFPKVVPAELLKGDVKTAHGPEMSAAQAISVQSVYVVPGTPAKNLEALQSWDPTRHSELKIYLHGDLPASPTAASFSRLESAPGNSAVKALAEKTASLGNDLQISAEEAKKFVPSAGGGKGAFPEPVRNFWATVLAGRAQAYASGGAASQPGYNHTGKNVNPGSELSGLLRQQGKISKQFGDFLSQNGVRGSGSLKKDLYYELINVDDDAVLMLGSFSSKATGDGGFQAADVNYYASGGFYATLTLYQMWAVDAGGQPATLVWRGDLISAGSLAGLHGIEKLASESATMKDISKTVSLLRRDTAGR